MASLKSSKSFIKDSVVAKFSIFGPQFNNLEINLFLSKVSFFLSLLKRSKKIIYPAFSKNLLVYSNVKIGSSFTQGIARTRLMSKEVLGVQLSFKEANEILEKKFSQNWSSSIFFSSECFLEIPETCFPNEMIDIIFSHVFFDSNGFSEGTIKFMPVLDTSGGIKLIFRGIYGGSPSRFNTKLAGPQTKYLIGTGNPFIDLYQKVMTAGFDQVATTREVLESGDAIIYDSFPRENIDNLEYRKIYSQLLRDGRDCCQIPFEGLENNSFFKRIEKGNLILRPKTWVLAKDDLEYNIYDKDWLKNRGIPDEFLLNIFGGLFLIDVNDYSDSHSLILEIFKNAPKKVNHVFIEENLFKNSQQPIYEVFLGFKNE